MSIIVIGSGISGLNFALRSAQNGNKVTVITKKKIAESSTNYAQGGIAAVFDKTDNFKKHIKDTMQAGAYHNKAKAVEFMVKHGPEAIRKLMEIGVPFTSTRNKLVLTREGGHSRRRIAFVGDHTGQEIERTLVKKVRKHPNIKILEYAFAVDLLIKNKICHGVSILWKNRIKNLFASTVIIAAGGLGQLFEYTTNPEISTGDGYAMAFRAGCKFKDMEFIQFHPTAFYKPGARMFLLSEALRGEGAILKNVNGKRFINELSPRDIVARSVYKELKKGPVYLDIRNKNPKKIKARFPQIYNTLKKYNFDLTKDQIPIAVSAHYCCGGIKVNLRGETNIKNLYAFGEVACTGVHGANRLASNSLLEALVFSGQILKSAKSGKIKKIKMQFKLPYYKNPSAKELKRIKPAITGLKKIMWERAGVIRSAQGLRNAEFALRKIEALIPRRSKNIKILELKNMLQTSMLVISSAMRRKTGLGCHFMQRPRSPRPLAPRL